MKLAAAVAISVVCLTGVQPVDAAGRALRSNCPDYDGSASVSVSASESASSTAEASASDFSDVTIDTPEPTTATPAPTTATPEPTTATPAPTPGPTSFYGTVTLYSEENYGGDSYTFSMTESNRCYSFDCFPQAKSVKWDSGVPHAGSSILLFHRDADCAVGGFGYGTYAQSQRSSFAESSMPPLSVLVGKVGSLTVTNGATDTCPA